MDIRRDSKKCWLTKYFTSSILSVNTDPRFIRSQQKLYQAIIELASETPLEAITVTAIANKADVHRSTVYEHATSAAQLLRQAIHQELDLLHTEHGINAIGDKTLESSVAEILKYLEDRESLFQQMNKETGAEIRDILRSHFIKSLNKIFETGGIQIPETKTQIPYDALTHFTVFAITDMHVGIFAAALQMDKKYRSADVVTEMIRITSPYWIKW